MQLRNRVSFRRRSTASQWDPADSGIIELRVKQVSKREARAPRSARAMVRSWARACFPACFRATVSALASSLLSTRGCFGPSSSACIGTLLES